MAKLQKKDFFGNKTEQNSHIVTQIVLKINAAKVFF